MAKINFTNIIGYIQGKVRYKVYYNFFNWLIREHIKEQIEWRIMVMEKSCYTSGACMLCGCSTTALQMANKPCDKPCYPGMMNSRKWKDFKQGLVLSDGKILWGYKSSSQVSMFYVGEK